jgi:microcystin degradation protein MlrC
MLRIAIAGFHIESCTFSPLVSGAADFLMLRGDDLAKTYGFLARYPDVEATAILRARATPGGPVDRAFYDAMKSEIIESLRAGQPWDGVFLHLHGAANVVGLDDAEGDLIAAVRAVVGPDCPISASYDLHGNVSQPVFDGLDILSAYRTAPHIDWYETVERAFTLLIDCVRSGVRPFKAFIPVPILLPGEQTSTEWEPAGRLYKQIPIIIAEENVLDASILIGYVWADEPRSTASVLAFGDNQAAVDRAAKRLAQYFWDVRHEFQFGVPTDSVDNCINIALAAPQIPVVISDSGDNPTAGGAGDVPYTLGRLMALNVPDAVYASMPDPKAIAICRAAGVGAMVELRLGGKLDPINGQTLSVKGQVLTLASFPLPTHDTADASSGVMNHMAVVQIGGILCIITTARTPFHHIADFTRLGIDPSQHKIVVVKIGYLEPELKQLAAKALLALSPGAVNQDIQGLPYQRIERPMFPLDPQMIWSP